jgi:hypothetical protein
MTLHLAARPYCLLVCGISGTGKTTFALRYLVANDKLAARFIFDPDGEAAQRFGLTPAESEEELELSLDDGFTIYDPHAMFPGKLPEAMEFFCGWAFEAAARVPGEKVLMIDEAWRYCSPNAIPESLAKCIQTGRKRRLGMIFLTQRPNRLNEAITNETSELVSFRLQGENALKRVSDLGADRDEISALAPGAFVAVNAATAAELRGRLW